MIKSMTGYGHSEYKNAGIHIAVEIKSVNHRYLEIKLRTPHQIRNLEENIKRMVKGKFSRGAFDVIVIINHSNTPKKQISVNSSFAKHYIDALLALKKSYKLSGEIDINALTNVQGIITVEDTKTDTESYKKILEKIVAAAIKNLEKMRKVEGIALKDDITTRIALLKKEILAIKRQRKKSLVALRERLSDQVKKFVKKAELSENRLSEEIAYFAGRSDISEEITRLSGHLGHFLSIIKEKDPIGRKLDFLLQEMNREANTLTSKANDFSISGSVILIKSELEKIREQIQNIE